MPVESSYATPDSMTISNCLIYVIEIVLYSTCEWTPAYSILRGKRKGNR